MSKESIIKELPDAFVKQMRNWVKTGSCVGLYAISPAYGGMPTTRVPGSRILADFTEVSMLEHSIEALPNRERQAVRLFWMYEGQDLVWMGRRMQCHYETVEGRVRRGHDLMRRDLAMREAAYERHLERGRACA